jgi:hypothetical protein
MTERPRIVSINEHVEVNLPNPDLAQHFRELAELAEAGQIGSFAGVIEYIDDEPDFLMSCIEDPYRMSGLLYELRDYIKDDE